MIVGFKILMIQPDELGALLCAIAIVELDCFEPAIEFFKLVEGLTHQSIGYGHFLNLFNCMAPEVIIRLQEYSSMLSESSFTAINMFKAILEENLVNEESPFGIFINRYLTELETSPLYNLPQILNKFNQWIQNEEVNPLPLLLEPDVIFSDIDSKVMFSPLPSGVEIPQPESIELIPKDSPQSILYHALLHARQKKTTLAMEEMSKFCLKLSEMCDDTMIARSSVVIGQIFDLIGLKESATIALNESIDAAKNIQDTSVMATAVALKTQIDSSKSAWKYAAAMENSNPIAKIHDELNNNKTISSALKVDPQMTFNICAETNALIASILPLNERILPIQVLKYTENGEWQNAAKLVNQLDISLLEVRSTALALAVAYFDVHGFDQISQIYADELKEVLSINIGHFSEMKETIAQIQNVFKTQFEIDEANSLPYDKPLSFVVRCACNKATNTGSAMIALRLCAQYGYRNKFDELKEFLTSKGVEVELESPNPVTDSIDVEIFIRELCK